MLHTETCRMKWQTDLFACDFADKMHLCTSGLTLAQIQSTNRGNKLLSTAQTNTMSSRMGIKLMGTVFLMITDHFIIHNVIKDGDQADEDGILDDNGPLHYTTRTTRLLGGILVSLRQPLHPSVRPVSRVRSVAPIVLVASI